MFHDHASESILMEVQQVDRGCVLFEVMEQTGYHARAETL